MIFKISKIEDSFLQGSYHQSMRELNEFYGLDWVYNCPKLVIVPDRETIDALYGRKSEDWQVGWVNKCDFAFVLNNDAMETNSCHKKHSSEKYTILIKHELSHAFFQHLSKGSGGPKWFWEGVAIYTSGQTSFYKKPEKFEKFLDSTDESKPGLYQESGFAIELLVRKYGKEKLLELVGSLPKDKDYDLFAKKFKEIYSFAPTYENFNNLL